MTDIDYAERVQRGIALLDEKWPAWATEIDLEELDIRSGTRCMTAQYAKRHDLGGYWHEAMESLGLVEGDGTYEGHGFNADNTGVDYARDDASYATLNGLWKAEIERRRAQGQDAPAEPEA
jgi:hypothetical protein